MSVDALGYLGLAVKDVAAFEAFATGILGLMPAASPKGDLRLRMDERSWRFQVESGDTDEISFIGFEVAGPVELDAMARRLRDGGIEVVKEDAAARAERGVLGLISCSDPEGLRVEIFYGATVQWQAPFISPAAIGGFLTGELGLGHIAMASSAMDACREFYTKLFGFRLTDIIDLQLGPDFTLSLEFFHCNPRHHTLAFAPMPMPQRLQHVMVQVSTLEEVGLALDRATAAGCRIMQSLGRHSNDRMVSFYVESPAGFQFEFGFDAIEVDDATWRVTRHDVGSSWGHKPPVG